MDIGCGGQKQHFFEDFYGPTNFDEVIGVDAHNPWIEWRKEQYKQQINYTWIYAHAEDLEITQEITLCTMHHVLEHIKPEAGSALLEHLKEHCEFIYVGAPGEWEDGEGAVRQTKNPWMAHECLIEPAAMVDRGFEHIYNQRQGATTNPGYIWRKK